MGERAKWFAIPLQLILVRVWEVAMAASEHPTEMIEAALIRMEAVTLAEMPFANQCRLVAGRPQVVA